MREQIVKNVEKDFLEPSFSHLVKHGLENTSVRDLCKAMGVSSGSVYYWFEGKDDVYISAVKYGISKVANKLFEFAFDTMSDPKLFFDSFLQEIDKYKPELRLIFQVTTSPVYGDIIRNKAEEFKEIYEKYINKLSKMLDCSPEKLTPIIFMLISVLVDYVVWEDTPVSEMQMKYLYDSLQLQLKVNAN